MATNEELCNMFIHNRSYAHMEKSYSLQRSIFREDVVKLRYNPGIIITLTIEAELYPKSLKDHCILLILQDRGVL